MPPSFREDGGKKKVVCFGRSFFIQPGKWVAGGRERSNRRVGIVLVCHVKSVLKFHTRSKSNVVLSKPVFTELCDIFSDKFSGVTKQLCQV
jgi:hypothetical protein